MADCILSDNDAMNEKHIGQARALDAELVKAAGHVRVLQHLTWPFQAEEAFLSAWHAGRPELPAVRLEPIDYGPAIDTLESIATRRPRRSGWTSRSQPRRARG